MLRNVIRLLVLLLAVSGVFPLGATAVEAQTLPDQAQGARPVPAAEAAAEAARELSRLEAERDFDALYDRLHPDSRAIAPRAAVVGWYEAQFAGKRTAELTVTGVQFVEWFWEVNGKTYARTASVSFVQPYWVDGVRSDEPGVVHLVAADGEWGWFFGASRAFVDEQIALYAPDDLQPRPTDPSDSRPQPSIPAYVSPFPDPLHAHVDAFWAQEFAEAGRDYEPPGGVVGFSRPTMTSCGRADPATEAAFYCLLDETIYYSADFRAIVEAQVGDFGWIVVVAHEWGHHVQLQLGYDLTFTAEQAGDLAPIELEQQADCVAGAYTGDAEDEGWLDPGDVEEALFMTELAGDPTGTPWDTPGAHGTGEERVEAFLSGYEGGLEACDLDL